MKRPVNKKSLLAGFYFIPKAFASDAAVGRVIDRFPFTKVQRTEAGTPVILLSL